MGLVVDLWGWEWSIGAGSGVRGYWGREWGWRWSIGVGIGAESGALGLVVGGVGGGVGRGLIVGPIMGVGGGGSSIGPCPPYNTAFTPL